MKRITLCLLTLMLCLLCPGALALEDTVIDHGDMYFAMDLEAVGDTLYTLAEKDGAYYLVQWQDGFEVPVMSGEPINYALSMYLTDAQPVDDGSRIATMLFTDGQRLMSLDPVLGVVFSMEFSGSELVYHDVTAVRNARGLYFDDMGYTRSLINAAASGDTAYWLTVCWDENGMRENRLDAINLQTGDVTRLPVDRVEDFDVMPDGKLLLLVSDASASALSLAVYDPASESVTPKGALWSQSVGHICYDGVNGAAVYMEGNRIMGVRNFMETLQYGYVPVDTVSMTVVDGSAAVSGGEATVIRKLQPGYQPACELTVLGGSYAGSDAAARYSYDHQDTALYWFENYGDLGYADHSYEALLGLVKEDQMDAGIVTMNVSGFEQMMKYGHCADLSAYPELMQAVDRMYQPFREAVTSDGALYGVPLAAFSSSWGYDPSALAAVGLTPDELPTNLIDLCAFITRWNDEMMDQHPDVALFGYVDDTRAFILGEMINQYAVWCEDAHGTLTFDTPEFRALLAAAGQMSCDRIDERVRSDAYRKSLLFNDLPGVGYFGWSVFEQEGYAVWMPMSIAPDVQPVEQVSLDVAFIHADCADDAAAAELIAFLLDGADPAVRATLFTDVTEPAMYPDYQASVDMANAYLASLYEARDASEGDERAQYDVLIAEHEAYISETLPTMAWMVSEADLAFYRRQLAPNMRVVRHSCVSDWTTAAYESCHDLLQRYARGTISADQLIAELQLLR